jgi:hypothetical protein
VLILICELQNQLLKIQSVFTREHWESISTNIHPYHLLIKFKPGFGQVRPSYLNGASQTRCTDEGLILYHHSGTNIEALNILIGSFGENTNRLYQELLVSDKCSDKKLQKKINTTERRLEKILGGELAPLDLILT